MSRFTAKPRRGFLVGISEAEQVRLRVPKDRPWLILQNDDRREHDATRTVLACPLTDELNAEGKKKRQRCGDYPLPVELNAMKNSFIRLGEIYPVRESEIVVYRGKVPPSIMVVIDMHLADLLGLESAVLVAQERT